MRRKFPSVSSRHEAIHRLRGHLERDGYPRLQMMLLVGMTGAAGFLASYGLLHAGFEQMWVRYAAACGIAYLVFFALLWLWMRWQSSDFLDAPDTPRTGYGDGSGGNTGTWNGGGGQSGGGGASSSFDAPAATSSAESGIGDALGSVADADELAIPLLLIALVVVLLLSSFYVVYSAPILFAELLLDGVLATSLYRRLRRIETRHWVDTAVRRTVWPFVVTAALLAAVGFGMGHYAPEADSIGDVLHHARQK